ncbi:helix-turn-helix domain-containing protein [Chitinophaga sp. SYP-B3965]|uniref:AraC family transcriptional regulator n=1 Tax=Chitinophaga sp. SYP-B3965 TaxID=2663120 RepID=UPI001299A97A|nr:AraC family transcriptional regulator [Chitinophaga sp. SYP-B3965]MRG45842.1 helix-turn-helix domain-containing protein [Chitinophaga sp. SYP-B3965]
MLLTNHPNPARLSFGVSAKMRNQVNISSQIPDHYKQYELSFGETEFTEGPFGCYFTQVISEPDWTIGWMNFFINKQVTFTPVADIPMAMLYCSLQGNIVTKLYGRPGLFSLQHRKFGFYYVPPKLLNKAVFKPGHYKSIYFSFSAAHLSKFVSQHLQFAQLQESLLQQALNGEQFQVFEFNSKALQIVNEIKECRLEGPAIHIFLQSRINELLLIYFSLLTAPLKDINIPYETAIRDASVYIGEHYSFDISIPKLARKAGMNINAFTTRFRKIMGTTPAEYIQRTRIEEAEHLLLHSDMSVEEIGAQVGFTSRTYFSRVFRKHHALSPLQYKHKWETATAQRSRLN